MEVSTLQDTIIKSDSLFSQDVKRTIVHDEVGKKVKEIDERRKIRIGRFYKGGDIDMEIEDVLEVLEASTGEYWVWIHEEYTFRHCKTFEEFASQYKEGSHIFSGKTEKMMEALIEE
jgi:hypothetical protein